MEEILKIYYADNAQKLRQTVHAILKKFGGLSGKDYSDFYSVANDVFADIVCHHRYDPEKGNFDGFLYRALRLAIIDEFKKRNCEKRTARTEAADMYGDMILDAQGHPEYVPLADVSLDAMAGQAEDLSILDTVPSNFDLETALSERMGEYADERVEEYLDHLPMIQSQILRMKMEGIPVHEIQGRLGLQDREYRRHLRQIRSFQNIRAVREMFSGSSYPHRETKEEDSMMTVQTAEKSKPMQYSIASINKKIENRTIRFDHPLQRNSDQWSPSMKGNLISDILQGNPLPEIVFAEQIVNGTPVIWDLDGKQRCTNCYSYANDGFKICRNIRKWNIKYLAQIKDQDGNPVLDDDGFPISEYQECDIRNKKFSQLPIELQEKFLDYTFKCDQYLNCDSEEIAYHIIRYNEGKAMSKSQKGITRIGETFAALVKEISAMSFFRDGKGYKDSEARNGTLDRVVIESVMASRYLDHWSKQQEDICGYLKEHASTEDFAEFKTSVLRLESVITEEVAAMFNSRDSFLWFGLFARFTRMGREDTVFIEFLSAFSRSLHSKVIDGSCFDELCIDKKTGKPRPTKDKYIVLPKMDLLEKLLIEYLGAKGDDRADMQEEEFIAANVGIDIREVRYDLEFYQSSLDDLLKRTMAYDSKLLETENRISLLAMVVYSYKNDLDLDEWMTEYAKKTSSYLADQKENFLHMVSDLEQYRMISSP